MSNHSSDRPSFTSIGERLAAGSGSWSDPSAFRATRRLDEQRPSLDRVLDVTLLPAVLGLGVIIALFELTPLDLFIQDQLFDFTRSEWMLDADVWGPRLVLHEFPTVLCIVVGLGLVHLGLFPATWRRIFRGELPSRRRVACAWLTLATVPLLIGLGKQTSNMFCPSQLERYGGNACYVRLFERHPATDTDAGRGHCFPAGHASGPFALVGLLALARTRKGQLAGLALGLVLGWIAGGYQIVTGSHYVSHTLVTMLIAWIVFLFWRRGLGLAVDGTSTTWRLNLR